MPAPTPTAIRIRCFGPFAAEINGEPLPVLHSKKERLLLAYLALRRGREVERGEIAAALWPDSLEEQARFNLRQTLSSLRKALGSAGSRLESPSRHTLCLNLFGDEADVIAYDLAARRTDEASLEIMAALQGSPLLEGWGEREGEGWAAAEREARSRQSARAARELCRRALSQRDYPGAKRWLQQLAQSKVVDEALWREYIQALLDANEFPLALRAFEELETHLNSIDRALPAPETLALHQRIPEAERKKMLWQAAPTPTPQLPLLLNRFVGREAERDAILRRFTEENGRLMTLTGPGGVGKTRLALEAARELAEPFAQNIWFAPLADIRDADEIPAALLKAFRRKRAATGEPFEQAAAFLNARKAPTLLILDNFEQLTPQGVAMVQALLSAVPRLTCLITSRRRLGIAGETSLVVPPLPAPEGKQELHELARNPSVQLFIDRARTPRPAFQLTEENAQEIAALCRRLEGLPLAIELTAMRASMLTPAQMLAELERRFALLTLHDLGRDARHQSLQATLQWSYDLLPPELQTLFARLSVFCGGWTLEAAQSVCQYGAALDGLDRLHTCSLLLLEEVSATMRWRMLQSVQEFAGEALSPTERAARRRRHARYFLALARRAQRALKGAEQDKWLSRLEREQENLRAALTWALENDASMALRFGNALARYWEMRGYLAEDRAYMTQAVTRSKASVSKKVRMRALLTIANMSWHKGDPALTKAYYEESFQLAQELEKPLDMNRALTGLGIIEMHEGRYEAARLRFEESLARYRAINNVEGMANLLHNLGSVNNLLNHNDLAAAYYLETLAVQDQQNDALLRARSLTGFGIVRCHQGRFAEAQDLFERGFEIIKKIGSTRGIANSLHCLGLALEGQGETKTAWARYAESLRLRFKVEDQLGVAESLEKYAQQAAANEQAVRAVRLLGAAEAIRESVGLGTLHYDQGECEATKQRAQAALSAADFQRESAQGAALTTEQAVEYALE